MSGLPMNPRQSHMRSIFTRCGFTLMEMLAVILLISTIIGFGVPALYSSEKKQAANNAMNQLLDLHRRVSRMQVMAAARGYVVDTSDQYTLTVYGRTGTSSTGTFTALDGKSYTYNSRLYATVTVASTTSRQLLQQLMKEQLGDSDPSMFQCDSTISNAAVVTTPCAYYRLIDADQALSLAVPTNVTGTTNAYSWKYEVFSGMISAYSLTDNTLPLAITFKGSLNSATGAYRINQTLNIYGMGYSDVK